MVFRFAVVGSYLWSNSNDNVIKIWRRGASSTPKNYEVVCVGVVPLPKEGLHFMTSSYYGTSMFTTGGDNHSILEYTPTGNLIHIFPSFHQSFLTGLICTVSPDRLWSCDESGVVCWFEIKRGKKTIERLQSEGNFAPAPNLQLSQEIKLEVEEEIIESTGAAKLAAPMVVPSPSLLSPRDEDTAPAWQPATPRPKASRDLEVL